MFTVSAKLQAQIDAMIEAYHDYIPSPDGLGEEYSVYNFFDEGAFIVNTNGECDMNKATKLVRVAHSNNKANNIAQENKPQTKYIAYNIKGDNLGQFDSLQSVGDYMFTLTAEMLKSVYAQDITPCFYPYHTFKLEGNNLVGTMHKTLEETLKALL